MLTSLKLPGVAVLIKAHDWPLGIAQNYNSNLAAFQILLVGKIFVTCEQHLKSGFFRSIEQFTIFQSVPA